MPGKPLISSAFRKIGPTTWLCLAASIVLGAFFVGSYLTFARNPRNVVITDRLNHLPVLTLPCRLDLRAQTPNQPHKLGGWSYPEVWGTWTDGSMAYLGARFPTETAEQLLTIDFEIGQICLAPISSHPPLELDIWINDIRADHWTLSSLEPIKKQLQITLPAHDPAVIITFHVRNPVVPDDYGYEGDMRELGLGLASVRFSLPAAPSP